MDDTNLDLTPSQLMELWMQGFGDMIEHYRDHHGSYALALAHIGQDTEEYMKMMAESGKPFDDFLDALGEEIAVFQSAQRVLESSPQTSPASPKH